MSEEASKTTPIDVQEIRPGDEGRVQDPKVAEIMAHAAAPHMEEALEAGKIVKALDSKLEHSTGSGTHDEDLAFEQHHVEEADARYKLEEALDDADEAMIKSAAESGYSNEDVGHSRDAEKDQEIANEIGSNRETRKEFKKRLGSLESEYKDSGRSLDEYEDLATEAKESYVNRSEHAKGAEKRVNQVRELKEHVKAIDFDSIAKFNLEGILTRDEFLEDRDKASLSSELEYLEYVLRSEESARVNEYNVKSALEAVDFDKDISQLSGTQVRQFMNAASKLSQ